jgi:uncharacterized protein (DUF1697 family)
VRTVLTARGRPLATETYIALLRGINVGGHKLVGMADLRELLTALDFTGARSLLQSGNLVFRTAARTTADLERLLEAEAAKRLGLRTDFFVRTAAEWDLLAARNPFRDEAASDPARLLLMILKDAPGAKDVRALQAAITGPEIVRAAGRQAYIFYPDGVGRSRLTGRLIEDRLGTRGTGRNWNTVLKLVALAKDASALVEIIRS